MFRRFVLPLLFVFATAAPVFSSTFTVDSLGDESDQNPGDNICLTASNTCTLRAALEEANAVFGPDTVNFSVAGTINLTTALPALLDTVTIDGTTAPGYVALPVVQVEGGGQSIGFEFDDGSQNSTLRALGISGFSSAGVQIFAFGVTVQRNYIGQILQGTTPNGIGVQIFSALETIGGAAGEGNVISGNSSDGIQILGGGNLVISANLIGVDPLGAATLNNGGFGVDVLGASDVFVGGSAAITNNVISGNLMGGVELNSSVSITVAGNLIGTDATGTVALGNGESPGIDLVDSSSNFIGTATARNIVSGHGADGIVIRGLSATNIVVNNYVGTDITGTVALPNVNGIVVTASNNTIGTATKGNVISGNSLNGISAPGAVSTVIVRNNIIGLDATGTTILGNGADGVNLCCVTTATIGGAGANQRNVISGNGGDGIHVGPASGVTIEGNYIGVAADGITVRGNGSNGIELAGTTSSTIGGGLSSARNVISGNSSDGILVSANAAGNTITNNAIGTNLNGSLDLGNLANGIEVNTVASANSYTSNQIEYNDMNGVLLAKSNNQVFNANTIAQNTLAGVSVDDASTGNHFANDNFFSNGALGIDLGPAGVTPNDPLDPDTGANQLQNFPTVGYAVANGSQTQVGGTINTTPSTTLTVHVYSNTAPDPSGYGEGQTHRGSVSVTTDASGNATWIVNVATGVPLGSVITATADSASGTSEFSQANIVVGPAPQVQFSQATYGVVENAGPATLTVTRTGDTNSTVTVNYTTTAGTATAGADYTTTTGTLTFGPGVTSQNINVPIVNDTTDEPAETFTVTLSNPSVATLGAPTTATVTINDDDPPPAIAIDDPSQSEGNGTTNMTFTVTLSNPSSSTVTVDYATANGTATAGSDYTATSGTLTFTPGTTSRTILVPILGDTTFEPNETFVVNLTNPSASATIGDNQGTGTIVNDDTVPVAVIGDKQQAEGNSATTPMSFTVTLSNASSTPITIDYATADGTALGGEDYVSTTGTATFAPGTTTQTIDVPIVGDTKLEPDETFFVALTSPNGATIGDAQATGTIQNDDSTPTISIADAAQFEGNGGTSDMAFTVTLSNPSSTPVSFNYATTNGSATAGSDYNATSGTFTFAPGTTSDTIFVAILGDTTLEPDETVVVTLSNPSGGTIADGQAIGTIRNDDGPPTMIISDVTQAEGTGGTTTMTFTVTLSNASTSLITANFATADGTAQAGSDYTPFSGLLAFFPGTTTQQINVQIVADTVAENDETFTVNLSNPSAGTTIGDAQGVGTIVNDDAVAPFSISNSQQPEGNTGTSNMIFTVTLAAASPYPMTVDYATADGTATAGQDYVPTSGTLTFAPGVTTQTISVPILGDYVYEPNETFVVNLTNPSAGTTVTDSQGLGTILNDEDIFAIPTMSEWVLLLLAAMLAAVAMVKLK